MQRQNKAFLMLLVLPVFLVQASPNILGPHMATFEARFPDIALSTVMLLQNIPTGMGILGGILTGPIQNRFGLKGGLLLGCIFFVVGGMIPLFSPDLFALLIVSRFIYGFGFGFLYAFAPCLVIGLFTETERPRMMGLGTAFQTLGVIVFSMGGTLLASRHFNNIWLIHLLILFPLILSLFLREPPRPVPTAVDQGQSGGKERLTRDSWILIIIMGLVGIFFMPMFTMCSNVIVNNGFGTTTDASFLLSVLGMAGVVGALLYSALANKLAKIALPIGAALMALGTLLLGISQNMMYMYAGAILLELGFTWVFPTTFNLMASVTPPTRVSAANGLQTAFFNGGSAISTYVVLFILSVLGLEDLRAVFSVCAVFFLILAIVYLFYKPRHLTRFQSEVIEPEADSNA